VLKITTRTDVTGIIFELEEGLQVLGFKSWKTVGERPLTLTDPLESWYAR
jgi:hypothetical protein